MLNQTKVTRQSATTRKTYLVDLHSQWSVPCVISDSGVSAVNGRKIVKAGTPITGNLLERGTAFTVDTTAPVGFVVHDVDVTEGSANGAVMLMALVDLSKFDTDVQAMYTTEVIAAMNRIQFIK